MSQPMNPQEGVRCRCSNHEQSDTAQVPRRYTNVSYSVILILIVQTILFGFAESSLSTIGGQLKLDTRPPTFELDPIVFNPQSLYNRHTRHKRAAATTNQRFVDACQSRMEVLTPYYATNSKGKLRTIVNSELMQQAIQIETCVRCRNSFETWPSHTQACSIECNDRLTKAYLNPKPINHLCNAHTVNCSSPQLTRGTQVSASNKCNAQPECGCEQKYKWHRLLALDPADGPSASKGLFMDWFLFPSNCVCRCKSAQNSSAAQFLKTMIATTTTTNNKRPHQATE